MSAKTQHNNILLAAMGSTLVIVIVGLIGFFTLGKTDEVIQGEIEVTDYRVSSKLPGRIVELKVKEGDYVHVGDTLAVLQVPEVSAQKRVAEATGQATEAMQQLTDAGARAEQLQTSYQMIAQAKAAADVSRKTYQRMERLYEEGVTTAQKRDEALSAYQASTAAVKAAESQYKMLQDGARAQEKQIAAKNTQAAKNAVDVVNSLLKETVQISQVEGEVSDIYPHVGELVGLGSPIMSISVMKDMWGDFNIREDKLKKFGMGKVFTAYVPAFDKNIKFKVYYLKDEGTYAVWRATKTTGDYDRKTFEVKARPITPLKGLRPGMSLVIFDK
jgi:HlyD family secretion protein